MNNEQFRKLILANSNKSDASKDGNKSATRAPGGTSLGSRQRSNMTMTPRSLGGAQADFARQFADRNQVAQQKKFKTAAPKGAKLGAGYIDRTRERLDDEKDDRTQRLKALEESYKNEEIDQETFDRLRAEIAGGDLESTHLVKGLDFKLLRRIREGEDVYAEQKESTVSDEDAQASPENVDDEFDELEKQDVEAIVKEGTEKKKGQLSTVTLVPGKKRTRDQILAELKAARAAATKKAQEETSLGDRFRKIGAKLKPGTRIERDRKGREVLIIVDEDGHEKRKVRKQPRGEDGGDDDESARRGILMPDKDAKPLGMEVPEQYQQQAAAAEEELDDDGDIFEGVGDDYDPLAGIEDSDSGSESDGGEAIKKVKVSEEEEEELAAEGGDGPSMGAKDGAMLPPPRPAEAAGPRNYFKNAKTGLMSAETIKAPSMSDPAIQAAIKRAAALKLIGDGRRRRDGSDSGDDDEEEGKKEAERKAREEKRRQMLLGSSRDDADIDMGFGTSRFEDEEDFDDSQVKLSTWGKDDDGGEGGGKSGMSKRKRGPKKRKGDGNNAEDVLRVMEQRKKAL